MAVLESHHPRLVSKMPHSSENHCDAMFVSRGVDFAVLDQHATAHAAQVIAASLRLAHVKFKQSNVEEPFCRRKDGFCLRRETRRDHDLEEDIFELIGGFFINWPVERNYAAKD